MVVVRIKDTQGPNITPGSSPRLIVMNFTSSHLRGILVSVITGGGSVSGDCRRVEAAEPLTTMVSSLLSAASRGTVLSCCDLLVTFW